MEMKPYNEFAIELAREAGAVMRRNFHLSMKKQWKADNSPVTETDLAINKMVVDAVKRNYPDHAVLGEEQSDLRDGAQHVWVCDPVDGTVPFSHGIPTCVFSLALVRDGEPIVGVVYDPFMDRMFFAEKGKGATLNGAPTRVAAAKELKRVVISVYPYVELFNGMGVVKALDDENFIVDPWSITYMGMLVASGDAAAIMFQGVNPWDTAALKVIIEEAGGKVTDVFGNEQRYDRKIEGCLATNGILHEQLLEIIRKNPVQ
jgi:fructose-1,6-bisphosphatase/inositol monophosphatase family enzyme